MSLMLNSNSDDSETLYSDSVFSTYLYTGNGSTQTITNGIDLAGKGGLVWLKNRTNAGSNLLFDTSRGANNLLQTNQTDAQNSVGHMTTFNSAGFGLASSVVSNASAQGYASWTFREAAKFFDVVTYTGTGSARTIAHSLGVAPGMVIVKRTDTSSNWQVYSNGLTSAAYSIQLNLTAAQASAPTVWNSTAPTSSVFSVGTDATVNASGGTYVAYLFAHDTSSTGIIQCGSVTGGATNAIVPVTLGYEAQFIIYKRVDSTGNWTTQDVMRGWSLTSNAWLFPNNAAVESVTSSAGFPTATGFTLDTTANATYIYMAIRMPNKPPTTGTQVFAIDTRHATNPAFISGFPVDAWFYRDKTGSDWYLQPRLTQRTMYPNSTAAESVASLGTMDSNIGVLNNGTIDLPNIFSYMFKRAPGFFDIVCYTGAGVARTVNHNLGVVPELMIVKSRNGGGNFSCYHKDVGATKWLPLNGNQTPYTNTDWENTAPSNTVFYVGSQLALYAGITYVAYLFATLSGISKVGSYTGNGSTQNIECGFAAGARFVLIKRTDSTGDWFVWDTARGIVTGNDPHLSLNTTVAEVTTDDSIDPYSPGFTVNQVAATNINVTSATYIFLAIA